MRQKIAVTGANGQVGSEIISLSAAWPQFEFIFLTKDDLPIADEEKVKAFFDNKNPQYLINCAAYTAVDKAETEKEQAFLVNAQATGILAKACFNNNCRFIHISTDYVFDGSATQPYKEDAATSPLGVYGASKLEGEKLALKNNSASIIIRTSWVYSSFGKNFVKTMLRLMSEKEQLNVVSDQVGSPTHAADLADAIMQIIRHLQTKDSSPATGGIYHYSNEGVISWYDFAVAIKELSGSACKVNPIPTSQYPTPAKRPAYSVFDKTKITETFGISLQDWKSSLKECLLKLGTQSSQ
jgi:dTDP-4-dehydrorhamnose reductase